MELVQTRRKGDGIAMKVLVICRFKNGKVAPYISQQVDSIRNLGVSIEYFPIHKNGWAGYLKHLPGLRKKIIEVKPDLVHAHYGFSGLLAVMQRKVPVITTFHGSDINNYISRFLSMIAVRGSFMSFFVSEKLAAKAKAYKVFAIIPCGIDLKVFYPVPKEEARQKIGMDSDQKVVLFSSSSGNAVKNYPLAFTAIKLLNPSANRLRCEVEAHHHAKSQSRSVVQLSSSQITNSSPTVHLMELIGYSQKEVNLLLNACDIALLTSKTEGSPNFIKEAMACNRPIVSTDVGDVRKLVEGIPGCFIAKSNPEDVADKIIKALQFENSISARQRILEMGLDQKTITGKIIKLYERVLKK